MVGSKPVRGKVGAGLCGLQVGKNNSGNPNNGLSELHYNAVIVAVHYCQRGSNRARAGVGHIFIRREINNYNNTR